MANYTTGVESPRNNSAAVPHQTTTTDIGTADGGSRAVDARMAFTRSVTTRINHRQQKN